MEVGWFYFLYKIFFYFIFFIFFINQEKLKHADLVSHRFLLRIEWFSIQWLHQVCTLGPPKEL